MPQFRYPSCVLREFVETPKRVVGGKLVLRDVKGTEPQGQQIEGKGRPKSRSKEARVVLEPEGGRVALIELVIRAGRADDTTTYHAALLVDHQRIRGIDYGEIERKRWFKVRIPKGWHENIVNSNSGENRHEALDIDSITDLAVFCRNVAKHWHISYEEEETIL